MTRKMAADAAESSKAVQALYAIAAEIYEELDDGQIPHMKIPLRTKANIRFDSKHAVWKYGKIMGVRSAKKLKGALMLLRTMYVLDLIRDMINESKSSTLREMYYISEGWDIAKFHSQDESNLLAEDLEVVTQLIREDFKLRPEESGASVIGNLTIEEVTRTGGRKRINCRDDVGDAGYTIPYNVEKEKVKLVDADAKFVLAIETGGMFDRLVENGFDEDAKSILVHLKGQPSRSTRRLVKRLNGELKLPVATFSVDGGERVVVWDHGALRSVTIGPFIDRLMEEQGFVKRYEPIEHEKTATADLDIALPTIASDGSFVDRASVSAVIRHPAPKEMFEIQAAYGFSIKVTGSHSVMVLGDYELIPRAVKDLTAGDYVVAAMGLPRLDRPIEVDTIEVLRNTEGWGGLRTDVRIGTKRATVRTALSRGRTDFRVYGVRSRVPLPRKIPTSRPLAKLLGYFAAEGSATKAGITLSFGAREPEIVEDAVRSVREVFPGVHITRSRPHPYEVQLRFGGRIYRDLFEALGTGHGAHTKAVPHVIFTMDRENQLAFLRAYIRGDGHARRRASGASIQMTTVSRTLASDLLALLAQLGLNGSVRRRRSIPSAVVPEKENKFSRNVTYDVCLHGELAQLREFRELLDLNTEHGVAARQRINSKYLAIPREIITDDMRRIIRRFSQGKGIGRFSDIFWGCKRITYPVLERFLANVPEGKSEHIEFLRRLIRNRVAVLPVRRVVRTLPSTPWVYDFEVPGVQTFLGGLGPLCLHNTDGDPWSFRIHASVAYGAIKTAHISEYLATPTAEFVGITPSDILNYQLPTDALTPRDVGALNAELTDPRFADEFWRHEIQTMLEINKKAEQQALAKYGLDYVTDTYLPEKLGELGMM